ncbi:MAG: glycerol-3-phosphate dehydrogenase subunit GlpB [Marinifilaceae bacterium]|nr:glycerol-3-phosphate dehydrogenase subunit GlpB [Marinifilaceae bacterium]
MKFDTLIIGGGLAGLVCGIYLQKHGQRCVIVSSGQSALHFSSGSFDLLNYLPDGTPVQRPFEVIGALKQQSPRHPYAKLGEDKFKELSNCVVDFLTEAGVQVVGNPEQNHYRVTPMGTLKPTWLTFKEQVVCEQEDKLPWKKIALFNITGFLDFYSRFIIDEFQRLGTECVLHEISFPAVEGLRQNPTEMRSVNIARLFDKQENLDELVRALKTVETDCEVIVLPAIAGLSRDNVLTYLEERVNKKVCLLPTLPPSVPGIRAQQQMRKAFERLGGVYMLGDTVLKADREGNSVVRVYSYNHGDIPFMMKNVVLATGSYFSQGLIAVPDKVYEPVLNLDVDFIANRKEWYDMNVFAPQAYEAFGVKTDDDFRGISQGQVLDNVYVIGAILEGFNAIKQGCGAGVSILSALYVAKRILSK